MESLLLLSHAFESYVVDFVKSMYVLGVEIMAGTCRWITL
jgi:hypothetical protein